MSLPKNLDSIDLAILRAIGNKPDITTREIEGIIYLSRVQVLRRLRQLQGQRLVIKKNGNQGQTFHYDLGPGIVPEEIESQRQARLNINRDPIAREALEVLLQGIRAISDMLAEMAGRIENILR